MLANFLAALRFLTILPVPGVLGTENKHISGSLPYFSPVGLIIGGITAAAGYFFHFLLPPLAATLLALLVLSTLSGGLHLDGLADTADGFCSSRPRPKILAIMRDSRIGVMGVLALIFCLGLKLFSLASLSSEHTASALLLMPLAGRTAIIMNMAILPYARPEGGLGSSFYEQRPKGTALFSLVLLFLLGFLLFVWQGLIIGAVAGVAMFVFAFYSKGKIGGATGDTLGAASEITETVVALAAAVLFNQ